MKRFLFSFLTFALLGLSVAAQEAPSPVEIFCGADLGYADNNWLRLYDVQLDLTPGVKWHLANDWQLAAQAVLPAVSEGWTFRDDKYKMIRLSMATVSKQLHFASARQHLKLSAGLFGADRWGADVRWMMPVCDWLLLQAQAGLTSYWFMGSKTSGEGMTRFDTDLKPTFLLGGNIFLKGLNTELRGQGGRYINEDYGLQGDVVTHFAHCSVDLFYQLRVGKRIASTIDTFSDRANGGFKIVVMLPPYKKSRQMALGSVAFRPASNFRLTNNVRSDGLSMKTYTTDPEENERELQVDVDWGFGSQGRNNGN